MYTVPDSCDIDNLVHKTLKEFAEDIKTAIRNELRDPHQKINYTTICENIDEVLSNTEILFYGDLGENL